MTTPDLPINTSLPQGLSPEKRNLLEKHLSLVLEANKAINLTRISTLQDALLLHIEDSLSGLFELNKAPIGHYADLGTGAGYPGIPLSIVSGRRVLLVDSLQKKAAVLDSIIEELGLKSQVNTYAGRIEKLARERRGEFSVLTARALSSLPSLLELASPLLCLSGHMICFKAKLSDTELENALLLEAKLGMRMISDREFLLSDEATVRRILVFEKTAQAKIELPRKEGLAQKNPFLL